MSGTTWIRLAGEGEPRGRGIAPAAYALSTSKASMLRDSGSNATPIR